MSITNHEIMARFKQENNIPLNVELYSFATWNKMGYKVKKGEHAKYKINMWKHINKNIDNKKDNINDSDCEKSQQTSNSNNFFMTKVNLFTRSQVEKI